MTVVVVTGAAGGVGRRLLPLLVADDEVARIVAVDVASVTVRDPKIDERRVDVGGPDALGLFRGADLFMHLAFASDTELRARRAARVNVDGTRRLLQAAGDAGVGRVVALSSATVYGAWPNNPVPLTEDAPLRPNAEFSYAVQRAQLEQLVTSWSEDGRGSSAVLRPCATLGPDRDSWMARSFAAATGMRTAEHDPARQFLHVDDLATALDVVRRSGDDGAYNVAPDGWVAGDVVRALSGAPPRIALPARVGRWVASMRWHLQRGPIPPGMLPYTMFPWIVANDRLKGLGWRPTFTNEQAYVAGTDAKWWTTLTPNRKQELALGGFGVATVGAAVATGVAVRRAWRRAAG
jgi:nucleoside-diphosphate-sugar epimerase